MKAVVTLIGVVLLAGGLGYLLAPDVLAGMVQQSFHGAAATTDFRATYGGFHVALAWTCFRQRRTAADLHRTFSLLTTVIASVAFIRLCGVLTEPHDQMVNFVAGILEAVTAAFTGYCARRCAPPPSRLLHG